MLPRARLGWLFLLVAQGCADRPLHGATGDAGTLDARAEGGCTGDGCATEPPCPATYPDRCSGICVSTLVDERHCGQCGNACPEGATCRQGACACGSTSPDVCEGACVDTKTDTRHCGGCGQACAGRCRSGACTLVAALAPGGQHTLARLSDGTLAAWGYNGFGQLGDGTRTVRLAPVVLTAPTSVADVAAGRGHTCAALGSGTVQCWGDNAFAQVGDGTALDSATPLDIAGVTTATHVAAGGRHGCALEADGTVWCWGWNANGQVGDGTTGALHAAAAKVLDLPAVVEVVAGASHGCARTDTGDVYCWGDNGKGQLGDGTTTLRRTATPVTAVSNATAVRTGGDQTCALLGDATVKCWGGEVISSTPDAGAGDGGAPDGGTRDHSRPATVPGLSGVTALAVGRAHVCAATSSSVRCWGDDAHGQLGDGALGTLAAAELAAGDDHTCARTKDGTVWCWGDPGQGRLGTTAKDGAPAIVAFP